MSYQNQNTERRRRGVVAALRSGEGPATTMPIVPVRVLDLPGETVQQAAIAALLHGQAVGRRERFPCLPG